MDEAVESPFVERARNLMTQFVELGSQERNRGLTPVEKKKLEALKRDLALAQQCIDIEDALRSDKGGPTSVPPRTTVATSTVIRESKLNNIVGLTTDADVKLEENAPITYSTLTQQESEAVRRDSLDVSTDDDGMFASQVRVNQGPTAGLRSRRSRISNTRLVAALGTSDPQYSERSEQSVESVESPAREVRSRHRAPRHHIASVNKSGAQTTMFAPSTLGDSVTWIRPRGSWYYCESVPCIIFGGHNGKYFVLPACQGCGEMRTWKGFFKGISGLCIHLSKCSMIKHEPSAFQEHLRLLREITLDDVRRYLREPGSIYLVTAVEAKQKEALPSDRISELEDGSDYADDI